MYPDQIRKINTLQFQSISPEVKFQRLFPKVRLDIIGVVGLWGKNKFPHKVSSKNQLMNMSHVISPEVEICSSLEVKVFK